MSAPSLPAPLPRSFYDRPTDLVARELLGCLVARRHDGIWRVGRVVETEAYLGERDRAAHSWHGRTARTEVMFGPPGHAYVFCIYGLHWCLNAVTRPEGEPEAVLVRAIEPLAGCLDRGAGPGLVGRALAVDRGLNGADLVSGEQLFFAPGDRPPEAIVQGPRVGVDYAGAWARRRLRFYEKGSPFVSPAGRAKSRAARAPRGVV
jgi:DNA-3-methyladenine glycosylase